jgi:hypothetical protein
LRTTLTIDDDIMELARERADFERRTVGEVISELARKGLSPAQQPALGFRNGVPLLPIQPGAKAATLDLIKELMDETP